MKPCEICSKSSNHWIVFNDSGNFPFCCKSCFEQIMERESTYGGQYFVEEVNQ